MAIEWIPVDFTDVNFKNNAAKLLNLDTKKFTNDEMMIIKRFKTSFLHQILIKDDYINNEINLKQNEIFILPCDNETNDISWEFLQNYIDGTWSPLLKEFLIELCKTTKKDITPNQKLKNTIIEIMKVSNGEYVSSSAKMMRKKEITWNDIELFSKNLLFETEAIIGLLMGYSINNKITLKKAIKSDDIKILNNSFKNKIEKNKLQYSIEQPLINCKPLKIELREVNNIVKNLKSKANINIIGEISNVVPIPSYMMMEAMVFRSLLTSLIRLQSAEKLHSELELPKKVPLHSLAMAFSLHDNHLESCRSHFR